ncbi:MAG TPA: fumarylacetoacetase [Actinobacteria bacterium]|nr:fumarylacetoacetase [Actinomycetota bacterium]
MTPRIPVPPGSDFPLENLPYGVFDPGEGLRLGVAVGDHVLDLRAAARAGQLPYPTELTADSLNPFLALGRRAWEETRAALLALLTSDRFDHLPPGAVRPRSAVRMHLPFEPGDFVDFYASFHHAANLGRLFRPGSDPVLPNWRHLPVAYHGRSSSVVVSGTPVRRPHGLLGPETAAAPTAALDFELEVGFVTGPGNRLGDSIPADAAADHMFGMVLVNDWSARDIQRFEYVPLGPFLGKSFATSVSPWVVTLEALWPYLVAGPEQEPEAADYLRTSRDWAVDLSLEAVLRTTGGAERVVTRVNYSTLYWSMAQQLAHVTVNGTNVRPGDLYASGTVSGAEPGSWGSLIEITRNGAEPISLDDGSQRTFLEDGDTIVLRGWCERPGLPRIGFGECVGTVLPASR